jgi:hypothetical protein
VWRGRVAASVALHAELYRNFPSSSHFPGNHFVHVAPDPIFSGLDGAHYRMMLMTKMFGGVLILGRITATHVAARHAHSEMNPGVAGLDAVFTDIRVCSCDFNLVEVLAFV